MNLPYVDEVYRAVRIGLQVGATAVILVWLWKITGLCSCLSGCLCSCSLFLLASIVGSAVALHVDRWRLPSEGRGVFITGCDSGFGLALALRLQSIGCVVFAACKNTKPGQESEGVKRLRNMENVHIIPLDVTDDQQVAEARVYVEKHMPIKGLWGVVNNAGVCAFLPTEWASPEDAMRLYDINALGALRIAHKFLPLLRQTKGRMVNMSCVSGRWPGQFFGIYCMSKFALEAFTDCLRFEQRRFGVKFSIVEPGNFAAATNIIQNTTLRSYFLNGFERLGADAKATYGDGFAKRALEETLRVLASPNTHSQDLTPVLVALEAALFSRHPAARYHPSDIPHLLRTWFATHGPEWLYEYVYG